MARPDTSAAHRALHFEVEQFLFYEAELLDERRYNAWLELFTNDVRYWMPTRFNRQRRAVADPLSIDDELETREGMAWFDDDRGLLEQRVRRLQTLTAWAENPPSRTRRLLTNLRVRRLDDEVEARCNFLVFRSRLELEEDQFFGTRVDRLRRVDGKLRIAARKIIYDATVSGAKNLSMLL